MVANAMGHPLGFPHKLKTFFLVPKYFFPMYSTYQKQKHLQTNAYQVHMPTAQKIPLNAYHAKPVSKAKVSHLHVGALTIRSAATVEMATSLN